MTPFSLSGVLAFITALSFGVLVLYQSPDKKLGRIWFIFSLSSAGWGVGCYAIGSAQTVADAVICWRSTFAFSVIWIPVFFHHFVCYFCGENRLKELAIQYFIAVVFFLTTPFVIFFEGVRKAFPNFYAPDPGLIYPAFFIWWIGLVVYSHVVLVKAYRVSSEQKRNQIKYFFLATSIGYVGGSLTYLPHFEIDVYPWGNFAVFVYPLIMSYAILKYRLMDIRIFVRRTALIVGIYFALAIFSLPIFVWANNRPAIMESHLLPLILVQVVGFGAILSMGPFLYAYFVRRSSFFHEQTMAGLTHELKSPLATIQSVLDLLQFDLSNNRLDPRYRSYVDMISRNSDRLQLFINDLLYIFKYSDRKPPLVLKEADLGAIIEDVVTSYESPAKMRGNKITFEPHQEIPLIDVDGEKVKSALSNLMSNACKFTENGSITIRLNLEPSALVVSVSDTGVGISQQDLPYVFDRFFQNRSKINPKGTGIGLSIAKLWVEAHGGKIWAESEGEGKGTTVTFTLPTS